MCVTGAWDKKACVWDARASNDRAQHTMHVSERVYCMDVSGPMLILGAADQQITLFDLRKPEVHMSDCLQLNFVIFYFCEMQFFQEIVYSFNLPFCLRILLSPRPRSRHSRRNSPSNCAALRATPTGVAFRMGPSRGVLVFSTWTARTSRAILLSNAIATSLPSTYLQSTS